MSRSERVELLVDAPQLVGDLADNLFGGKASQMMGHLLLSSNLDQEEVRSMRQSLDDAARRGRDSAVPEGGVPA